METDFPRSKAAALARIVRARIKLSQRDYAGAASLLNTNLVSAHTSIGDYALMLRADALEQAGKPAEARIVYEQLVREHPSSSQVRKSLLQNAAILTKTGSAGGVALLLKDLVAKDDAAALLLAGKANEQLGDTSKAVANYRRLYFYAAGASESAEARAALDRLGSSISPANADEAISRAERLYESRKYADAFEAYTEALTRFSSVVNPQTQLRRGISAAIARKTPEAISALTSVSSSAGDIRAEALSNLAQTYARARQWDQARSTLEEMRRGFPESSFTPSAFVSVGRIAEEAKNTTDASYFLRTAVNSFKQAIEVAQAQFDLAWQTHESKNYRESSQQLTEHLALYVDRNNDNRGRAGYWAARDSERAGKLAEARALYQAMLGRYDANWYGYLAKQRLEALGKRAPQQQFPADSMVGRAVANLQIVNVADETAGPSADTSIIKAYELTNTGLDSLALEELEAVSSAHPNSPKVNLAIAQVYRSQEENVRALNALRRSFPDYSQMKPEEMTREQWDVFYPLAHWDIIVQESRARNLDPYQVAGLIRQETVFITRAKSSARAYGLMQVLVPTAALTARKYGVDRTITAESLYEPRLNIQLGTAYLRDQIDKFGRIEYVAAAYNAGPGRAAQWRTSLPFEIDEWAEAVPFKETRGYVQGVVRNRLQYERLYDKDGNFRPEVGSRAVTLQTNGGSVDSTVRKRRVMTDDNEE
jgi:soluble lytic murein transglycosylase